MASKAPKATPAMKVLSGIAKANPASNSAMLLKLLDSACAAHQNSATRGSWLHTEFKQLCESALLTAGEVVLDPRAKGHATLESFFDDFIAVVAQRTHEPLKKLQVIARKSRNRPGSVATNHSLTTAATFPTFASPSLAAGAVSRRKRQREETAASPADVLAGTPTTRETFAFPAEPCAVSCRSHGSGPSYATPGHLPMEAPPMPPPAPPLPLKATSAEKLRTFMPWLLPPPSSGGVLLPRVLPGAFACAEGRDRDAAPTVEEVCAAAAGDVYPLWCRRQRHLEEDDDRRKEGKEGKEEVKEELPPLRQERYHAADTAHAAPLVSLAPSKEVRRDANPIFPHSEQQTAASSVPRHLVTAIMHTGVAWLSQAPTPLTE